MPLGPASAGRLSGRGWKRACGGPSCGCGEGDWLWSVPGCPRILNARPSPCRMKPDAVLSCPCPGSEKCKQPPVGCGHHPAIFGPRAHCATPHVTVSFVACIPHPFPNGTACARPSGIQSDPPGGHAPCGRFGMLGRRTGGHLSANCERRVVKTASFVNGAGGLY